VSAITYDDGSVIQYSTFDINRLPQTVIKENGGTETFTYNPFGRPLSYTNALQHTFKWTYTQNGIDVASVTDPLSETTAVSYDALRNPISIQNALNQTTTFEPWHPNRGRMRRFLARSAVEMGIVHQVL
jgi:YD repeat-containing protein